jgi:DNA-binding HxlR family transcriptional regulator
MVSGEICMTNKDYYFNEVYQTIDETFDYLRKKWNIKIIKGLFCDYKHFKDFLEDHPDLSSKVLSERLKELELKGIIEKKVVSITPVQTEYQLTEKGRRLNRIIFELFDFALDGVMKNESNSKLKNESKKNLKVCLKMI